MTARSPARLLYIASDKWFFDSHFRHVADAAHAAGYAVALAAGGSEKSTESLSFYPLSFDRTRRSFLSQLRAARDMMAATHDFQPDIVHVIGLHAILIFMPFLALTTKAKFVLAPIGLGKYWVEATPKALLARWMIKTLLLLLRGKRFFYLFENCEDAAELSLENNPHLTFVGGAGIDPQKFQRTPEPASHPIKAAVIARMLHSKGIVEAVEAVRLARTLGVDVTLDLWGAPDAGNSSSLTEDELRAFSHDGVTWHGATNDVAGVWRDTHIALLLSLREGLPKTLLEAAACGRPIVATDVPGCRTLVRDGVEGFLVPPNNPEAAARALVQLAKDKGLREKLGAAARMRVQNGFTEVQVQAEVLMLYEKAMR